MKRISFMVVIVFLFGNFQDVIAMITSQPCANCHVMHAQEVTTVATYYTPRVYLLESTCLGCHTGVNGTDNTPQAGDTPFVLQTSAPDYGDTAAGGAGKGTGTESGSQTLAGGNFYWVASAYGGNETAGHNVNGINTTSKSAPGGTFSGPLNCAGSSGCHGNRNVADEYVSMRGTHHQMDGVTAATGYRFLDGIGGTEDSDWEWEPLPAYDKHNVYVGEDRTSDTGNSPATTISDFCALCHGNFHSGTGDINGIGLDANFGSPWIRHPVDISMATAGTEYASYSSYSVIAPVATTTIDGSYSPGSATGDRVVMCLSCHRAHGTPYQSILRWNYKGWPASGTDGCSICHSSKS